MSNDCKNYRLVCPLPGNRGKRRINMNFSCSTLTSDGSVLGLGLADR